MIKSIRLKMSIVFILLIVSLQTVLFIINAYFIEDIFILGNKNMMTKMYREYKSEIDKEYNGEEIVNEISKEYGGRIIIVDESKNIIVSNSNRLHPTLEILEKSKRNIDEYIFFSYSPYKDNNKKSMVFIGEIQRDKYIIFEKPLGDIERSSDIAEKYIIISGALTIAIGSLIIFFLSKRLTDPILSINNVAQDISNLKFGSKVKIGTGDELSILGDSINEISEKLNSTLTELKSANNKLQEDIERERNLEKMRRKFVSNVSHELKTPISMIQGYADGLKHNIAKSSDDKYYYCDVIIDESKKMNLLIKDLLDLSSYESGVFKIIKEPINLTNLVYEICKKYSEKLFDKNIDLQIDIEDNININADKLRIEQVILNFLNNANRHVTENGSVKVILKDIKDYVYLSVYNKGNNIEDSELDNIWTSFYKSNTNIKTGDDGTGLGLAIVRAIIELHKGKYGTRNIKDGVEFWVELPKK